MVIINVIIIIIIKLAYEYIFVLGWKLAESARPTNKGPITVNPRYSQVSACVHVTESWVNPEWSCINKKCEIL